MRGYSNRDKFISWIFDDRIPFTKLLVVSNVATFILIMLFKVEALPIYGGFSSITTTAFPWTIITYPFIGYYCCGTTSILSLLFASLWLMGMGGSLERSWGTRTFGLFFVRLANFVNGELWGRPTDVPWAMIFPATGDEIARHPSQLYEAGLEGLLSFAVLWLLFWKSDARYFPGRLFGMLALLYGSVRFGLEFLREPDVGVTGLFGLTMGQTLCLPMIILGAYLILSSKGRRDRVEAVAGKASVS